MKRSEMGDLETVGFTFHPILWPNFAVDLGLFASFILILLEAGRRISEKPPRKR